MSPRPFRWPKLWPTEPRSHVSRETLKSWSNGETTMPLYTIEIHGRAVQAIPAETVSDIEESLDTWVGADLKVVLQHNKTPLWDGDKTNVYVREAWPEEA